jgi:hypothetical protein
LHIFLVNSVLDLNLKKTRYLLFITLVCQFKWKSCWLHFDNQYILWNLTIPNILRTSFCVRNRQVFSLYRLNSQRFSTLGLYLKFGLYRISGLFRIWFRQVWLYRIVGICFALFLIGTKFPHFLKSLPMVQDVQQ